MPAYHPRSELLEAIRTVALCILAVAGAFAQSSSSEGEGRIQVVAGKMSDKTEWTAVDGEYAVWKDVDALSVTVKVATKRLSRAREAHGAFTLVFLDDEGRRVWEETETLEVPAHLRGPSQSQKFRETYKIPDDKAAALRRGSTIAFTVHIKDPQPLSDVLARSRKKLLGLTVINDEVTEGGWLFTRLF